MARTKASRKYQLTFNNPQEHDFTHEVIKTTIATFKGCLYWCLADEIGEQGTPHTHLYAAFQNPVEFSTVQQRFYGAHIEPAKGTHQENRDYIRKEGKWQDDAKHETSVPGTFEESGELPPEENKRQKQSDAILSMIKGGASNVEILNEYPTAMNHLKNIDAVRQTFLEDEFAEKFRHIDGYYIWGKTRVGKTRFVMEKYGYRNVYHVTNYVHPFDTYKGQDVILFDEFRSSLPIKDMLQYTDGHPAMLPCRYADRVACYTKIYIVSNIPLEKQYPNVQIEEPETWDAFLARIPNVIELLPPKPDTPDWAAF